MECPEIIEPTFCGEVDHKRSFGLGFRAGGLGFRVGRTPGTSRRGSASHKEQESIALPDRCLKPKCRLC